jgi:1-deoxy-D-xylulose-5-phosphate synthase
MTLMAPRNEAEVRPMLEHALAVGGAVGIRYPRGSTTGKHDDAVAPIVQGKAEVLRRGTGVAILGYGNTVDLALDAYATLAGGDRGAGVPLPTIVNARFAKPFDEALLLELATDHHHIITLEEHSIAGGFGSVVAEFLADRGLKMGLERIGVPNVLVHHDSQDKQRTMFGLNADAIATRVANLLGSTPVVR